MIHIVIGTKAQLVKMAPILVELNSRKLPYNFIFTGQHQETMEALRINFKLGAPNITLHDGKDITSVPAMIVWLFKILWRTLFDRKTIFRGDKQGIVLVHGDTFSTLLGALMGRLARLKVGHVESGMRSFNYFHPFPEEITRILTFYLSDYYFCPGETAVNNIKNFKGEKIDTKYNTLLDSLEAARKNFEEIKIDIPEEKYAIVTSHRFENIFNKNVLNRNINLVLLVADKMKTIFIMHPITKERLIKYGLLDKLQSHTNIECRPRYDYFSFMKLVYHSELLVSDGGSNQEECWFMGKPCLLLRKVTEHPEGVGRNVVLSEFSETVVSNFLDNYNKYKTEPLLGLESPSKMIVDLISHYQ